jgi:N-acetylglucosaminyldiphosphoundecaprenol N-acetyl-beta-D-mannosaminyltransferase
MPKHEALHRVNILGVGVHAIDMHQALAQVGQAIEDGQKGYICVTGVHGIMESQTDPLFRSILNRSYLTTPDGMPTVWIGRLRGFSGMKRVFGPDLMLETCKMSIERGYTHFLYGGAPGVAEALKETLVRKFPGLKVVGTFTPPFRLLNPEEAASLQNTIADLRPDIFWTGLSTPKQERFMAQYLPILDTKLMFGVGAAFYVHTGRIKDAPEWAKNVGLQWLHRLGQEPRRLWKRYLFNNPKFVVKIAAQLTGLTKYDCI